jgi:broad specificity phosphatase PhoE
MVKIIFEAHSTSLDNEAGLSSGRFDVGLSRVGKQQAKELGARYEGKKIDVVFCSDLRRSHDTAKLAFGQRDVKIIKDARLSEIDYGDFTRHASKEVEGLRKLYIDKPFPDGQSYTETTKAMKYFLLDLLKKYNGHTVMIIGHRATQYALENLVNDIELEKAVTAPWTWQPGWTYSFNMLK